MTQNIIENKIFENIDFAATFLSPGIYDCCIFKGCSFNGSDLSGITLSECEFSGCDMSLVKLHSSVLKDVKFISCKLLGVHFNDCNKLLFSVDFKNCNLDLASFNNLKMKGNKFINCSLNDADFTEADLTGAVLNNCNLGRAIFESSILERADLTTSYNFLIDPEKNRMKKARFSSHGIQGLLFKYDIVIE